MNRTGRIRRLIENSGWTTAGLAAVFAVHFICFYWWVADTYYFSGDSLFYFSRRITTLAELWAKFASLDELYQYRPIPYVFFSFVLHPLFGTNPAPYHLAAYTIGLINILLACGCCYFWLRGDHKRTLIASVFLILNPVNFFPSYGAAYIDVLLSLLFYFLALIVVLANPRWAPVVAPAFAALALLSREHSVVLPAQAVLILLAAGVPLRQAIARTRNVWFVLAAYVALQLFIRQGAVFAPETANSNLQFGFSLERVEMLATGIKTAIYFPENARLNEFLQDYRRPVQVLFVIPWFGMILWTWFRRDKTAASGILWVPLSLLPIAFIQFPPFARHYYLALPGLAVLFASVVRSTRVMACVASILALVTVTNVAMYAQNSWIAQGSRLTKKYLQEIQVMADRSGRTDFYVLDEGDRTFYWNIDGGAPLHEFLNRQLSFRFAMADAPLQMDTLLTNSLNVVIPTFEGFHNAFETGRFPEFADHDLCEPISRVMGAEMTCAVFFRGFPIQGTGTPVVETPNGMPIMEMNGEIVTLSRTTVFLKGGSGIGIDAVLRAAPESIDGVRVRIYKSGRAEFEQLFETGIAPGEQIHLRKSFEPSPQSIFVLRIDPGPDGDERGDWLMWKVTAPNTP